LSLNVVGLNRIGLNQIGSPSRGSSSGTDRPYIDPEVLASLKAVCICYGKSNDDPDRAVVKNLVDPDNPFVISNAAFKLNSGFGEYKEDFTTWSKVAGTSIITDSKYVLTDEKAITNAGYFLWNRLAKDSFKVKISNIPNGGWMSYRYRITKEDTQFSSLFIREDGIYTLPATVAGSDVDFFISTASAPAKDWVGLTITQIPSFEGAFFTDGVEDLITSTKTVQEMGITDEVTVVSMIHQIDKPSNFITTNNIRTSGSVVGRNAISLTDKTGIYGWYKDNIQGSTINVINNILGDKADYTASASSNTNLSSKFSVVGYISNDSIIETSQVAWYWTIIANKVLTTDQINQVIAYFNLDRTLKPDILCDVKKQGITNDNHAEFGDKLIDFSGNGRDIQLNNIAWKGDSGIGKYEVDFLDSSIWHSSNSTITSSKIDCKNAISHIMLLYYSVGSKEYPDIPSFKVIKTGADIDYSYIDETGSPKSVKIVDGVNILPASHNTLYSGSGRFCGFGNPGMGNSVTITQIPSHAGGLCLDGINDFGKVTGMPVYKDYTVVTDREIFANIGAISSKNNPGAFVETAGNSVYSFGQATSGLNFISTRSISYLSKYSYCGQSITAGAAEDGTDMWLGTIRDNDSRFFNGAIYSLMSFPYSMSKFLIERQLKKYKLGTLYPNMVEFRPIIKSNIDILKINYWDKDWNVVNVGDYISVGNDIKTNITVPNGYKVSKVTSDAFDNITIEKSSTDFIYDVKFYGIKKSPQKISITIEQDENYVLFNPVINSNYDNYELTFHLREYEKLINIGDYIPKGTYIRANLYLKNNIDELVTFTFNGVNIDYVKSSVSDLAYNIRQIYNYDSPQEVNITIDEYIRYEDIKQPYPLLFEFTDENGNLISWGGKAKVGNTITRTKSVSNANILAELYNTNNYKLNGKPLEGNSYVVEKQMVFTCTATYLLDDNEPKCILSPRLLRIPNSSYKILGHIPDISGHGNHGVIHNSAYAEGSGVNEDGSYQFDGVDDFVTIPTVTGGKQVLMKVNWQSIAGTAILYDQRTNGGFAIFNRDYDTNENKVPAYRARNIGGNTYIDGILNEYIYASQLQNITHNIVELYDPELNIGTLNPKIGSSYLNSNYAQMSLYDFMLFDNISTDDKIKELNTYIGITPKVTLPNYYWDNYGKKNTDANRGHVDEQVSLQKTGTSVNPLENFNISYEGMSGYNGYPVVFGASKTWESLSGVYSYTSNVTNTTIHVTHAEHAGNGLLFSYVKKDGALANIKEIPAFRVTIGGLEGNSKFGYRYLATEDATKETLVYLGNGTHELAKSFAPTEALLDLTRNVWVGIFITPMIEGEVAFDCDITIEVLPEYENGLAYDGISDFSQNTEIEVVEDFTFLVKGSLLKGLTGSGGCIARKGDKNHYDTGGYAFIYCFDSPIESYRNSYYSFGKSFVPSKEIVAPPLIGYMTKTNVNGETTTFGTNSDIKGIIFGNWSSGYMNMVIYKSIFYTKTISLLEINFLKNLMEKDEIIDINHPIFISNTEDESNTSQDT
jgi:hypothetical protein